MPTVVTDRNYQSVSILLSPVNDQFESFVVLFNFSQMCTRITFKKES